MVDGSYHYPSAFQYNKYLSEWVSVYFPGQFLDLFIYSEYGPLEMVQLSKQDKTNTFCDLWGARDGVMKFVKYF
jgi:hypothetical protein